VSSTEPEIDRSDSLPIPPGLGCALSILVGLVGVAIFFVAVSFALRGEVRFSTGELTERRVWLVRDVGELGLGFSTSGLVSGSVSSGQACVETRVRFLMFQSADPVQPLAYCECLERADGSWLAVGDCE